jgi:methylmalonyl-CoA mutase N-terminal domain/subunit
MMASLDRVSISMTINSTAAFCLQWFMYCPQAGYFAGITIASIQNDISKLRPCFAYTPDPFLRLTTDIFAFCKRGSQQNTISVSYHIRRSGTTAVSSLHAGG